MSDTNYKMMFAEELTENDKHSGHFVNECVIFGFTWGRQSECLVYVRGECEMRAYNEELFANRME